MIDKQPGSPIGVRKDACAILASKLNERQLKNLKPYEGKRGFVISHIKGGYKIHFNLGYPPDAWFDEVIVEE
jgi:hypothetical protein